MTPLAINQQLARIRYAMTRSLPHATARTQQRLNAGIARLDHLRATLRQDYSRPGRKKGTTS
jgi:hypothetical protein